MITVDNKYNIDDKCFYIDSEGILNEEKILYFTITVTRDNKLIINYTMESYHTIEEKRVFPNKEEAMNHILQKIKKE